MSVTRSVLLALLAGVVAALIYGLVGYYSSGKVSPAGAPIVGIVLGTGFYFLARRRARP